MRSVSQLLHPVFLCHKLKKPPAMSPHQECWNYYYMWSCRTSTENQNSVPFLYYFYNSKNHWLAGQSHRNNLFNINMNVCNKTVRSLLISSYFLLHQTNLMSHSQDSCMTNVRADIFFIALFSRLTAPANFPNIIYYLSVISCLLSVSTL